jgi:hypothetical protein
MHRAFVYIALGFVAYLCQTVLYPALVPPELRVDLFLILVVHLCFSYGRTWTLLLALFLGLLMDVGLPVKGCFHPLVYMIVVLLGSLLWQNLNLHSRRYQAIFFGFCALLEGGGIWMILRLQNPELAGIPYIAQIMVWRTAATVLIGPLLLSGLEQLDNWLSTLDHIQESQQG